MMDKKALREKLGRMENEEALVLAIPETAFLDVNHIQQLTSLQDAVVFLASRTPVEAVALLHQMEPLASRLLVWYINHVTAKPEEALSMPATVPVSKLREVVELANELGVVTNPP